MVPGCYRVLNDETRKKISQNQADLTAFALDPRGARAPFAPPWIRRCYDPHPDGVKTSPEVDQYDIF